MVCRRRLLSVAAATIAGGLAGCTDDPGGGEGTTDDPGTDAATPATDEETATGAADLDLREANVTGVELEARDGGAYRFAVTLIHDDDGEDGYANWWQVETLDVMLPGNVPHTALRLRDPRGLGEAYDEWLRQGRIARR